MFQPYLDIAGGKVKKYLTYLLISSSKIVIGDLQLAEGIVIHKIIANGYYWFHFNSISSE